MATVLRFIVKHPFLALLAALVVFVLVLSGIKAIIGDDSKSPETPPTLATGTTGATGEDLPDLPDLPDSPDRPDNPKPEQKPDPNRKDPIIDESPEEVIEGQEISDSRAALPWLPLKTRTVFANYKKQLPTGELLVIVDYRGSLKSAEQAWAKFLKRYNDPGTAYLVVYRVQ